MSEPLQYLDFEINIDKTADRKYRVQINSMGGRAEVDFEDPFSEDKRTIFRQTITTATLRSSARVRSSSATEVKTMKDLGHLLFDKVISEQVREFYYQCLGQAQNQGKGLRMRLALDPGLSDLPWEFLASPQKDFLALDPLTPIVRFIELPTTISPLQAELPLRVLVVIASPTGMVELDTAAEKKRITEALGSLQEQGLVHVSVIEGPDTWPRLIDALRPNETHILHFIGHGTFDEVAQEGLLAMESEDSSPRLVDSDTLRILLQGKSRLRLVVLNACQGAQATESEPLSSAAAGMVRAGVPAVIAMQYEVSDQAAMTIAETFYKSLALNFPVDAALTESRRQIALLDRDSLEWATPVLYMQVPDGQLFDITTRRREDLGSHAHVYHTHEPEPARQPAVETEPAGAPQEVDFDAMAEEAYQNGLKAEISGDWQAAINGFQGALYAVPDYKDAEKKLAYCQRRYQCVQLYEQAQRLYKKQQYTQVLETLKQLRAIDPRWVDSADLETLSECGLVYRKAIEALEARDRQRGAELLRSIITRRPDFEDAVDRLNNLAGGGDGLFGESFTADRQEPADPEPVVTPAQPPAATPIPAQQPAQPAASNQAKKDERTYRAAAVNLAELAEGLRQHFMKEGHETQVIEQEEVLVVQGKKGGWRSLVGMSQAATVMLEPTEEGFKATVGGGKWIEQGAAIAVSMFVLWPLLITGGLGMAQQKAMMDTLWRIIDRYTEHLGGTRLT